MRRSLRSLAVTAVSLAVAAASGTGCAKKLPVGPAGSGLVAYPEGTRDSLERTPSEMIVWPDVSLTVDETSTDTTVIPTRSFIVYRSAPGVMHGLIVDYSQADAYQMFREEEGGGYRAFADFSISATRRWSDRIYYGAPGGALVLPPGQIFLFSDRAPSPLLLRSYVGRVVMGDLTGAGFPLTNRAAAPETTVIAPILYTGLTGFPGDPDTGPAPPDSLLALSWQSVPGAAAYWVHIYQKRADIRGSGDAIAIAHPSPVATGKVRDLFVGYFPAPRTSYKLGDPVPAGCRVLVYRVLQGLQEVLIRVSAVDANGRLIAITGSAGDRDAVSERIGQIDRRREFLMNAKKVTPDRPMPPD